MHKYLKQTRHCLNSKGIIGQSIRRARLPCNLQVNSGNSVFKKGFTLVELSIVLVIIGLLIGGILVAQSLIDSARIQKFVRSFRPN